MDDLADLERQGWLRRLREIEVVDARTVRVEGTAAVSLASNDYLGLSCHPAVVEASRAIGMAGSGSSRAVAGNLEAHRRLEDDLAKWAGVEAALLFNSGYHANVGILPALAGPGDVIYSDALNHASIIDGCRLSRAHIAVYSHCDCTELIKIIEQSAKWARRRFIVTESMFSMDGDVAPLAELEAIAERFDAALVVDEAHAFGARGDGGRGAASAAGVACDLRVGTLGKAFGSFGAFALASRPVVRLLLSSARSFVFTTALPPSVVASARAALAVVAGPEGDRLRERLAANAAALCAGLAELGWIDTARAPSHIVPLVIGDERSAMRCADALLAGGYFAPGIRPPTVPRGTSRLRLAVTAAHTAADIGGLLGLLRRLDVDGAVRPGGSR
jgi:8-amino-7-oxononanoate synthase